MRVSVIIPTYNRSSTLSRAVESVWRQKGVESELIIVDDGSTDETQALVTKYSQLHPQVRLICSDSSENIPLTPPSPPWGGEGLGEGGKNRGPAWARNTGIRHGRGEFIAFLDSDDEWLAGKLAAQLDFFEKNPDYLISQTEEIWIRNGRRVNPMKKHQKFGGFIFEKCLPLCIVSPSAVMMRREFFDRVGIFDEALPACEDYDLWLRASACLPIGLIEKPYVVKYGGHPDQRSRQFPVMDRFRIQALRKIIDSGVLAEDQRRAAQNELKRKYEIVARGARKRGKEKEAEYYQNLSAGSFSRHCEEGCRPDEAIQREIASAPLGTLPRNDG